MIGFKLPHLQHKFFKAKYCIQSYSEHAPIVSMLASAAVQHSFPSAVKVRNWFGAGLLRREMPGGGRRGCGSGRGGHSSRGRSGLVNQAASSVIYVPFNLLGTKGHALGRVT